MAWPRIESFTLFVSLIPSFSGASKWRYSKIQSSNLFDLSSLFLPLIFREINRFGCLQTCKKTQKNQFRSVGPWVPYPQDDKVGDLSPHRKLTRPQMVFQPNLNIGVSAGFGVDSGPNLQPWMTIQSQVIRNPWGIPGSKSSLSSSGFRRSWWVGT